MHIIHFLLILLGFFILDCSDSQKNEFKQIHFSEWKTVVNGKGYNGVVWNEAGYGELTATIKVPEEFLKSETPLGLYIECIDDSGKVFLDNQFIGEMGKYPEPNGKDNFRSASRESVLFPVHFADDENAHTIKIRVFNFSGMGGICPGSNPPLFGQYEALKKEQQFFILRTDILRTVFLSLLLFLILWFIFGLIYILRKDNQVIFRIEKAFNCLFLPFRPAFFIGKEPEFDIFDALAVRYFLNIVFCFASSFFIFSEVSLKYLILPFSENFYFKVPAILFGTGQLAIQITMYLDIFSKPLFRNGKNRLFGFLKIILALISSPILTLLFVLRLSLYSASEVWNDFTGVGLILLFISNTALFLMIVLQGIFQKDNGIDPFLKKSLNWQRASYAFILATMMFAILIFKQKGSALYPYSFLFMIFFVTCYMVSSLLGKVEWPIRAIEKEFENFRQKELDLMESLKSEKKRIIALEKEKEKIQKDIQNIKEQNRRGAKERIADLEKKLTERAQEEKEKEESYRQRIDGLISSLNTLMQINPAINQEKERLQDYCKQKIKERLVDLGLDEKQWKCILIQYEFPKASYRECANLYQQCWKEKMEESNFSQILNRLFDKELRNLFNDNNLTQTQDKKNLLALLSRWKIEFSKEFFENTYHRM